MPRGPMRLPTTTEQTSTTFETCHCHRLTKQTNVYRKGLKCTQNYRIHTQPLTTLKRSVFYDRHKSAKCLVSKMLTAANTSRSTRYFAHS